MPPILSFSFFVQHSATLKDTAYTLLGILSLVVLLLTAGSLVVLGVIVSIILHEFGHYVGFKWFDIPLKDVSVTPFGGGVTPERQADTVIQAAFISLLGPLFGLSAICILYPIFLLTSAAGFDTAYALIGAINVYNLLPYGNLDGGQLRDTLHHSLHDHPTVSSLSQPEIRFLVTFTQLIALLAFTALVFLPLFS